MTFSNEIGCSINISLDLSNDKILFSETGGFILEVSSKNLHIIDDVFSERSISFYDIGSTTPQQFLNINEIIMLPIRKTKEAWENGLCEKL